MSWSKNVKLGAGLNWSTSYQLFKNLAWAFFSAGRLQERFEAEEKQQDHMPLNKPFSKTYINDICKCKSRLCVRNIGAAAVKVLSALSWSFWHGSAKGQSIESLSLEYRSPRINRLALHIKWKWHHNPNVSSPPFLCSRWNCLSLKWIRKRRCCFNAISHRVIQGQYISSWAKRHRGNLIWPSYCLLLCNIRFIL